MFIEDTDGDDVADRYEVILHGFGTEDSHHSISAFTWGPGGGLYFQEGTFHHSQVETPYGPVRLVDAGVFRYKPQRFQLEVFVSYPFANPWGHIFDRWGQNFIADASGGANYFGAPITGNAPYPMKRRRMKVFTQVVRPTSGCEIVSSRHFPDEAQGNFLVDNTIGFQGIKQHRVIEEDSGFTSEEVEPLLYSTDINFRPVDLQFGPDGSLYLVDWFNPLIGHMQYSLRDERRDHDHGRVWRVRHTGKPLLNPPEIAGASTPALIRLLESYEDRTRYRVRRELRERPRDQVLAALRDWLEGLDVRESRQGRFQAGQETSADGDDRADEDGLKKVAEFEHHRLEGLWLYQNLADGARQKVRSGAMAALMAAAGDTSPGSVLPRRPAPDAWPADSGEEALAAPIVAAIEDADPRDLTSPRFRRIHDLGLRVADRMIERNGDARGADLREELVNLGPAIVTLRPVPHQMLFDLEEFTVRAGGPVEITFENIDVMPHNVVVTRPGALEEVGRAADAEAERNPATAVASGYVPKTPLVLFKTGLIQPGGTEVLSFTAPKSPGLYPFVCTFPGHWILMKGTMRVVERLDGTAVTRYAAPRLAPDVPQGAFVADWSYDMLEIDVAALATAPPAAAEQLDRGRRLFVETGCATCHQLGGAGGEIGPALDGVGERLTALDTLRHILEPSGEVAEDYRTWLVETRDGRFYSGLLASADDRSVRIRSNPLDPNHVETIPREEVESLDESSLSTMPSGLLSTLQPSEVQDLIRYVLHSP